MTSSETKGPASDLPVDQMLIGAAPPGFQTDVNNLMANRTRVESSFSSQWVSSMVSLSCFDQTRATFRTFT